MPETAPEPPVTDPPAQSAEPPAQPPSAEPAQPAATEPASDPQAQAAAEASSVEQLPSWAQKLLRDTRSEAAANRAKAKEHSDALAAFRAEQDSQRDKLAQALGLKPEEVTPEQLAAERDAERARAESAASHARQAATELAVFRAAAAAGADGNALLDSRSFVSTIAGLDPAADGFAQQVTDAITSAVEANSRYKLAPEPAPPAPRPEPKVPTSGPGQFTGPPNAPRQWTEDDVRNASPSEVQEAINKGLLESLGFGPRRRARR